jgi:hypothetical protein
MLQDEFIEGGEVAGTGATQPVFFEYHLAISTGALPGVKYGLMGSVSGPAPDVLQELAGPADQCRNSCCFRDTLGLVNMRF